MYLATRARLYVAAAALVFAAALPASAQDIAASHLKAARAAISAIGATDGFDGILPQAAAALKAELIQKNPDLADLINATVDEKTLELASRRSDLEREAATIYARVFSEEALNDIAQFYNSETGKKLLADGPIVSRQLSQAADIWQRGVARDLGQSVGEQIQAIIDSKKPAEGGEGGQANQ